MNNPETHNAFVAQGLEHCSSKAGVESSNLSEGYFIAFPNFLDLVLKGNVFDGVVIH